MKNKHQYCEKIHFFNVIDYCESRLFIVKNSILTLLIILFISLSFTGCTKTKVREQISKVIEITLPENATITFGDTHEGFLGDGTFFEKVSFSNEESLYFLKEIRRNKWSEFPIRKDVNIMLYGGI